MLQEMRNWMRRYYQQYQRENWSHQLDTSPTDITHLILFYSGSLVGKMKKQSVGELPK